MSQKLALFLSAVLSTFVLVTIAGVTSYLAKEKSSAEAMFSQQEVEQLIAERDAAFEQLISEANQQLSAAQAQLSGEALTNLSTGDYIPAEQASLMASQIAVGDPTPLAEAELVEFEGSVAYEIPFSEGNIYLDAKNGELLVNGTITLSPRIISPGEAEAIAAAYMNGAEVYRVEPFNLNGQEVHRVKFINSDAVFVDQYGQILLVRLVATNETANVSNTSNHSDDDDDHDDDKDKKHKKDEKDEKDDD